MFNKKTIGILHPKKISTKSQEEHTFSFAPVIPKRTKKGVKQERKISRQIALDNFIKEIKDGVYQDKIEILRRLVRNGLSGREKQFWKMQNLPSYFPAVQLKDKVAVDKENPENSCVRLSGIFHFDIDEFPKNSFEDIKIFIKDEFDPCFLFKSPSGGIKFGVFHDLKEKEFKLYTLAYKFLLKRLQSKLNHFKVWIDEATSAINSGLYVSYDPDLYYEKDAKTHSVRKYVLKKIKQEEEKRRKIEEQVKNAAKKNENLEFQADENAQRNYILNAISEYRIVQAGHGLRHRAFYRLGCKLKAAGLSEYEIIEQLNNADYDDSRRKDNEIKHVIDSLKKANIIHKNFGEFVKKKEVVKKSVRYKNTDKFHKNFKIESYLTEIQVENMGVDDNFFTLIDSPTNSGKTNFILSQGIHSPTVAALPLVPNVQQLQAAKIHLSNGDTVNASDHFQFLYGDKKPKGLDFYPSVVGTYDKIVSMMEDEDINLSNHTLHLDEAHNLYKSASKKFRNRVTEGLIKGFSKFKKVILYSGTYEEQFLDLFITNKIKFEFKKKREKEIYWMETDHRDTAFIQHMRKSSCRSLVFINNKERHNILSKQIGKHTQSLTADTKYFDENQKMLTSELIDRDIQVLFMTSIGIEGLNLLNEDIEECHILDHSCSSLDIEQFANRARKCPNIKIYYWITAKQEDEKKPIEEFVEISSERKNFEKEAIELVDIQNKQFKELERFFGYRPEALDKDKEVRLKSLQQYNIGNFIGASLGLDSGEFVFNSTALSNHMYRSECQNERAFDYYLKQKLRLRYNFKVIHKKVKSSKKDKAFTKIDLKKATEERRIFKDTVTDEILNIIEREEDFKKESKLRDLKNNVEKNDIETIEEKIRFKYEKLSNYSINHQNISNIIKNNEYKEVLWALDLFQSENGADFFKLFIKGLEVGKSYNSLEQEKYIKKCEFSAQVKNIKPYQAKRNFLKDRGEFGISAKECKRVFSLFTNFEKGKRDEDGKRTIKLTHLEPKFFNYLENNADYIPQKNIKTTLGFQISNNIQKHEVVSC